MAATYNQAELTYNGGWLYSLGPVYGRTSIRRADVSAGAQAGRTGDLSASRQADSGAICAREGRAVDAAKRGTIR